MKMPGITELVLILAVALIIFGPRKLPEIGRSIGKGIREFRSATTEVKKSVSLDVDEDEDEDEETPAKAKKQEKNSDEAKSSEEGVTAEGSVEGFNEEKETEEQKV